MNVLLSAAFIPLLYFVFECCHLRLASSSLLSGVTVLFSATFVQTLSFVFDFFRLRPASLSLLSDVTVSVIRHLRLIVIEVYLGCPFFSSSVCLCIIVRHVVIYICKVRVRALVLFLKEKMRVLFLFQQ